MHGPCVCRALPASGDRRQRAAHEEYFHDHVRIEQMLFEGVVAPVNGELAPDLSRPGMGLELKAADARRSGSFEAMEALKRTF